MPQAADRQFKYEQLPGGLTRRLPRKVPWREVEMLDPRGYIKKVRIDEHQPGSWVEHWEAQRQRIGPPGEQEDVPHWILRDPEWPEARDPFRGAHTPQEIEAEAARRKALYQRELDQRRATKPEGQVAANLAAQAQAAADLGAAKALQGLLAQAAQAGAQAAAEKKAK